MFSSRNSFNSEIHQSAIKQKIIKWSTNLIFFNREIFSPHKSAYETPLYKTFIFGANFKICVKFVAIPFIGKDVLILYTA